MLIHIVEGYFSGKVGCILMGSDIFGQSQRCDLTAAIASITQQQFLHSKVLLSGITPAPSPYRRIQYDMTHIS